MSNHSELALSYVVGVKALLAFPDHEGRLLERDAGKDTADQAEALLPLSNQLTHELAEDLEASDPSVRDGAEVRLLAKALADLTVAQHLLRAQPEQGGLVERSADGLPNVEELLRILQAEEPVALGLVERTVPPDLPSARQQLNESIKSSLQAISELASSSGQKALVGLLSLGTGELARAAGAVSMDFVQALGIGEATSRVVAAMRGFIASAFEALVALVGTGALKTVSEKVVAWVNQVKEGNEFRNLVEGLYRTADTRQALEAHVNEREAPLERFTSAIAAVEGVDATYQSKTALAEKLLAGLGWLGGLSMVTVPEARLLLAVAWILLGGYVVLAGGDCVDAAALDRLNHIPGVRDLVLKELGS